MKHVWRAFLDGDKCMRCGAVRTQSVRVRRAARPGEFDPEDGAPIVDEDLVSVHKVEDGVSLTKCRGPKVSKASKASKVSKV